VPDAAALSRELGCEVVSVVGHKRRASTSSARRSNARSRRRGPTALGSPAVEEDSPSSSLPLDRLGRRRDGAPLGWFEGAHADRAPRRRASPRVFGRLLRRRHGGLFSSIFWLASPLMDGAQCWSRPAASGRPRRSPRAAARARPDGSSRRRLGRRLRPADALLFLLLAALETRATSRARPSSPTRALALRPAGQELRALLSSFACAVPGIMSTRAIEDRSERLATILVAPFMGAARGCRSTRS